MVQWLVYSIRVITMRIKRSYLTIFCLSLMNLISCRDPDTFYFHYDTYEKAKSNGEIERGWILPFVPTSATDIDGQHNLDSNTEFLKFKFKHEDGIAMVTEFAKIQLSEIPPHDRPDFEEPWWFKSLNGFDLYIDKRLPDQDGYLAVNWKTSEAFYWTTLRKPPANP